MAKVQPEEFSHEGFDQPSENPDFVAQAKSGAPPQYQSGQGPVSPPGQFQPPNQSPQGQYPPPGQGPPGQFQGPSGQFQPGPGQFQQGQFQPGPGQFQQGQFQPGPGQFQPQPQGQFQPQFQPQMQQGPQVVVDAGSSKFHAYQLVLHPAQQYYYAGDTVSGRVVIHPRAPINCRAVRLYLEGEVHTEVRYTSSRTGSDGKSHTETHTAHQTDKVLKMEEVLLNGALASQIYVFPFTFVIPNTPLPSSFESAPDHVRYVVSSRVDCPFYEALFDPKVSIPITLLERIDVNIPHLAAESDRFEAEKTLCCCCCASGPLRVVAYMNHRAYVAGEDATAVVSLSNLTGQDMGAVDIRIKETKWKKAQSHTDTTAKVVASNLIASSVPKQDQSPNSEQSPLLNGGGVPGRVRIPAVPPTINTNSLKLTYTADVTVKVPGGIDLHLNLPIVIGTVPRVMGR